VLDQGLRETKPARWIRGLGDQGRAPGRFEQVQHVIPVELGRTSQQVDVELLADHSGVGQDQRGLGPKPGQSGPEHVTDA